MSLLLLVQSPTEMRSAVATASTLLVYQRRQQRAPGERPQLLGVFGGSTLDPEQLLGCGEAVLSVLESCTLAGSFSLCQVGGPLLWAARSTAERRRIVLNALLATARPSEKPEFYPVFSPAEAADASQSSRELLKRYPAVVASTWFVDDPERGLVPAPLTLARSTVREREDAIVAARREGAWT